VCDCKKKKASTNTDIMSKRTRVMANEPVQTHAAGAGCVGSPNDRDENDAAAQRHRYKAKRRLSFQKGIMVQRQGNRRSFGVAANASLRKREHPHIPPVAPTPAAADSEKKAERDLEYLAAYTRKLSAAESKRLEQQRTYFKLKVGGSIYGSLARNQLTTSKPSSLSQSNRITNRNLRFQIPQDVYLSLFRAAGTSRRLLNCRGTGQAPLGFAAFALFRKEQKAKHPSKAVKAVAAEWHDMGDDERQVYYGRVEEEQDKSNEAAMRLSAKNKAKTKKSKRGKKKKKPSAAPPPVLREVRKFTELSELTKIFGPATLKRNVGTILTPSGRIHVVHGVQQPVLFKYDGEKGELAMRFDYAQNFVRPASTRGSSGYY
jgi:hypothetical protein